MPASEHEIVLDALSIQERVLSLGQEISRDYASADLLVIGVLKGAFIFMADLVRAMNIPMAVDFIQVSSYGASAASSGDIVVRSRPSADVRGRDVLLVEDIIDSGLTVEWLVAYFAGQGARSVKVCALIDKGERRTHPVRIDYCGFAVREGFLIGYGLDFNEQYRFLPSICHLKNPA